MTGVSRLPNGGELIEGFSLLGVLGWTGSTVTYRGTDPDGAHVRVTEFLPIDLVGRDNDGRVVARRGADGLFDNARNAFASAGQALRSLQHPGVIAPDRVLAANGTTYLVASARYAHSLSGILLRRHHLGPEEVMRIGSGLINILEDLHRAGFIHGNLAPSSVFLGPAGEVVVDHFGSWRSALGDAVRELPCVLHPGCSALETYYPLDYETGPWTDVYGVASVMFVAATGGAPADVLARTRLLDATGRAPLPELANRSGPQGPCFGLARHVAHAIEDGLALMPEARPATPRELAANFSAPPRDAASAAAHHRRGASDAGSLAPASVPASPRGSRAARLSTALGHAAAVAAVVLVAAGITLGIGSGVLHRAEPSPTTIPSAAPAAGTSSAAEVSGAKVSATALSEQLVRDAAWLSGQSRERFTVELARAPELQALGAPLRALRELVGENGPRLQAIRTRAAHGERTAYRVLYGSFGSHRDAVREAHLLAENPLLAHYPVAASRLHFR